ncbi:MAG: SpoIIE family protein phosphatase [Sphingobacteriaceae bacterium]|nr:SpoIIE family protein phosphatase [Sphingobacteriaceae bacterium]
MVKPYFIYLFVFLLQTIQAHNPDSLALEHKRQYELKREGLGADTLMFNLSAKASKAFLEENKIAKALHYNKIQNLYYLKIKQYSKDSIYLRNANYNTVLNRIYILERNENYNDALALSFALLKEEEKHGDHRRLAVILNEIAFIYYSFNNYEQSLTFYSRGHKETEQTGDTLLIGASYLNLYGIHSALGDNKSAIAYCLSAAGCFKKINHNNGLRAAYANLAIYYQNINIDQSLSYARMAKDLSGGIVDLDNPALEDIIMAEIYLKKAQSEKSPAQKNKYLDLSYAQYKNVEHVGKIYNKRAVLKRANFGFSELERIKGNYKGAYDYYLIYDKYNDTLLNGTSLSGANSILKYEFDKKTLEQKQLMHQKEKEKTKDLEKQKIFKNFFILGFVLVTTGAFFIYKALRQKKRAMKIIVDQKLNAEKQALIIEQKQQQLIDGMNYAQNIQRSLIKDEADFKNILPDSVLYFKPKDIISGDFYWFHKLEDGTVVVLLADCTGHGVPGALLSMIGISIINEIVLYKKTADIKQILLSFSNNLKTAFKKNDDGFYTDGMEISICCILPNKELHFIGVNQALYVLNNNGELNKIEPQINSINGVFDLLPNEIITPEIIPYQKDLTFFLFSDGISDQFGGPQNKKFLSGRLEQCLKTNASEETSVIKKQIISSFEGWRGRLKQTDDVTFLAFKL